MAIGALIIGAVFVNNLILVQFLGICPFLGVSKKVESAFGMGMAVIFVMTVSSLISFALYQYVLVALGLEYLKTIVFIFVIAGLVQILEWCLKNSLPRFTGRWAFICRLLQPTAQSSALPSLT